MTSIFGKTQQFRLFSYLCSIVFVFLIYTLLLYVINILNHDEMESKSSSDLLEIHKLQIRYPKRNLANKIERMERPKKIITLLHDQTGVAKAYYHTMSCFISSLYEANFNSSWLYLNDIIFRVNSHVWNQNINYFFTDLSKKYNLFRSFFLFLRN